jgi:hypothetical protein
VKRSWLVIALALVLGAAFCVQATSTWRFGESRHLADLALPALVVLLEVGSITASAIFFSARSKGLRVRALLMLTLTAGLGGAAGVIAYGVAVGVTVAILMVGLVELVGAYRHETETTETTETTSIQTEPVQSEPQWSGPDTVELPRQPDTVPFEVESEPEPRKLEPVGWSVDQIVADLRERGETDVDRRGFQRYVRDTYSVGPGKATKVIDALKLQAVAS